MKFYHFLRRPRHWTVLFFLFLISLCSLFPEKASPALSTEEEKQLGEKFLLEIRRYYNLVEDDFANEYINNLGKYLIQSLESRPFPFRFYIIKDSTLNAFAAPGGHIFVFYGIIDTMEEVDELAAVICHEIAHVTARHLAKRIDQSQKIGLATMAGVLAGAFIGGKAAGAVMAGSVAAGIQAQLHYSRDDERQADQMGYKYMDQAGFHPSGLINTLNKMSKGQWADTEKIPAYLMTHPTGSERMASLDALVRDYIQKPDNRETSKFKKDFPYFRTFLAARCLSRSEAEQRFHSELERNPRSAQANFGYGLVLKEQSDYETAIEHFRTALNENPNSPVLLRFLGETYHLSDRDKEGIEIYEKLVAMDPQDRETLYLLAKAYMDMEQYAKAIPHFERLIIMSPLKYEIYQHLGVCYGREERLALAHYYFGIYFSRLGNPEKSRFHLNKAEGLAGSDTALRDRIRKAIEGLPSKK